MKMTGLYQMFPRVLEHLKDPGKSVADITSPEIDGIRNCMRYTLCYGVF